MRRSDHNYFHCLSEGLTSCDIEPLNAESTVPFQSITQSLIMGPFAEIKYHGCHSHLFQVSNLFEQIKRPKKDF